jgi:hypothetical protein
MRTPSSQKCRLDPLSRRRCTVWVFGWDFSENHGPHVPYAILRQHYSFTQGLLKVALDWTAIAQLCAFWTPRFSGHVHGSRGVDLLRRAESVHRIRRRGELFPHVSRSTPRRQPRRFGIVWFCPDCDGRFLPQPLTIARRLWLGLYWLNVHDGVAEWIAVDAPGNFENGIRIFGSSGDDIVYARVTWQWPKELEFSAMPPNMPSKLLLNADHRHRQSHSQASF